MEMDRVLERRLSRMRRRCLANRRSTCAGAKARSTPTWPMRCLPPLTQWKDGKRTHILLADVSSGAVRDLTPGDFDSPPFQLGGALRYDFSPDSAELAFVPSNHDRDQASSTNSDVWIVPLTPSQLSGNQFAAQHHRFESRFRRPSEIFARRKIHCLPDAETARL